jgi:hypothetical protein
VGRLQYLRPHLAVVRQKAGSLDPGHREVGFVVVRKIGQCPPLSLGNQGVQVFVEAGN